MHLRIMFLSAVFLLACGSLTAQQPREDLRPTYNWEGTVRHEALKMAPEYQTIINALKVVDRTGNTVRPPSSMPAAVRKQIDECIQFMNAMIERAESDARRKDQLFQLEKNDSARETLQNRLDSTRLIINGQKQTITLLEEATKQSLRLAPQLGASAWNQILDHCIVSYFIAIQQYQQVADIGAEEELMAAAQGIAPLTLIGKIMASMGEGGAPAYITQDEVKKHNDAARIAYAILQRNQEACPTDRDVRPCREANLMAYCAETMPRWKEHQTRLVKIARLANDGLEPALTRYANEWKTWANQAADYSRRTVAVMKEPTPEARRLFGGGGTVNQWTVRAREAYQRHIAEDTIKNGVVPRLEAAKKTLEESIAASRTKISAGDNYAGGPSDPPLGCFPKSTEETNVDAELEKLLAAFKEATEYENSESGTGTSSAGTLPADLDITVAGSTVPLPVGDQRGFTLTVTNNGPGPAPGTVLTGILPAGMKLFSVTPSQGRCSGTSTITCTLGTIAKDASAKVVIGVGPKVAGVFINRVKVASSVPDPDISNNNDTFTIRGQR